MSNYTGPITIVTFVSVVNPEDRFRHVFHTNVDDPQSIEKIVARFEEDGYRPDPKSTLKWHMVNGSIDSQDREGIGGPVGFRSRSAFLRA